MTKLKNVLFLKEDVIVINSSAVLYNGETLSNIGVNPGDGLNKILKLINDLINNTSSCCEETSSLTTYDGGNIDCLGLTDPSLNDIIVKVSNDLCTAKSNIDLILEDVSGLDDAFDELSSDVSDIESDVAEKLDKSVFIEFFQKGFKTSVVEGFSPTYSNLTLSVTVPEFEVWHRGELITVPEETFNLVASKDNYIYLDNASELVLQVLDLGSPLPELPSYLFKFVTDANGVTIYTEMYNRNFIDGSLIEDSSISGDEKIITGSITVDKLEDLHDNPISTQFITVNTKGLVTELLDIFIIDTPLDNEVLAYDVVEEKFVNKSIFDAVFPTPSADGQILMWDESGEEIIFSFPSLSLNTDIQLDAPTNGDVLKYNGTHFVNVPASSLSGSEWKTFNIDYSDFSGEVGTSTSIELFTAIGNSYIGRIFLKILDAFVQDDSETLTIKITDANGNETSTFNMFTVVNSGEKKEFTSYTDFPAPDENPTNLISAVIEGSGGFSLYSAGQISIMIEYIKIP